MPVNNPKTEIDNAKLKKTISSNSGRYAQDSKVILEELSKLAMNHVFLVDDFKEREAAMHILSFDKWMKRKGSTSNASTKHRRIGEIWSADLGSNYKPEVAYEHPVVVLGKIGLLVLVVPVTSTREYVESAYHPQSNPQGLKYYRKVGVSDGFSKECAVILSNIRAISSARLIKMYGEMPDINPGSVFGEIREACFKFCFPLYNNKLCTLERQNAQLKKNLDDKEVEIAKLTSRISELESENLIETNNFEIEKEGVTT